VCPMETDASRATDAGFRLKTAELYHVINGAILPPKTPTFSDAYTCAVEIGCVRAAASPFASTHKLLHYNKGPGLGETLAESIRSPLLRRRRDRLSQ
jgi:hypothetical protein